jgi:hypothetical protein
MLRNYYYIDCNTYAKNFCIILRTIYRPKCEQGVWRLRSNLELQNAYKSLDIVTKIKIRISEWLGYIIRMEDTGISEMILNTELEGGCGVGD